MPAIRPLSWTSSVLLVQALFTVDRATAQEPIRITDPAAIITDAAQLMDPGLTASMAGAGFDEETLELVRRSSGPTAWPMGLGTTADREANRGAIRNYRADLVAMHATETGEVGLVRVRARDNYHMPEDLRADGDIYLLVRMAGLEAPPPPPRPAPSPGPRYKGRPQARIVKTDAVYATYDLAADLEALEAMEKVGMSATEIEAVVFRCHQRNWPIGISDLAPRIQRARDLGRYKAYEAIRWNGKRLLIIPAAENRRLPEAIRPYLDIYMVYEAGAVTVKEPKRRKRR